MVGPAIHGRVFMVKTATVHKRYFLYTSILGFSDNQNKLTGTYKKNIRIQGHNTHLIFFSLFFSRSKRKRLYCFFYERKSTNLIYFDAIR